MLIEKCKHISRSNNIQIKLKSGTISCRHSNSHGNLLHRFYDYLANYYAQHCDPTRHLHRHGHRDYYGRRMCYLSSLMAVVLGVILLPLPQRCNAVGYSYTRFRGPVSGPEHRIYVRNGSHLDYVAKPEYEFAYGVEDTQAHILHNRNEMRDGDAVKGVYSVVDPDGTLRVVRYTADDVNGFQAEVVRNGISAIHGQLQKDTPAPSHIPTDYNNHYGYNRYPSLNSYSADNYNNNYQNPGYYYPATVNHVTPPTTTTTIYPNANPEVNVEYVNVEDNGEYHPQYEVHEEQPSADDENVKDEGEKENNKGGGGKKKDYDDDEDDEDGDDDDYDDSEELEDYDEAVKNNKGSDESDEYY
uniref:Cuticle protein n=1 Tax=Musca domestica TaxID=7370 RepID=A0A1I8NBM0_MUSDO